MSAEPSPPSVVTTEIAPQDITPKAASTLADTTGEAGISPFDTAYLAYLGRSDPAEDTAMLAAEGRVSRVGRELRIRFAGGRTGVYVTEGEERGSYRYIGYLKPMRAHVINSRGMEGSGAFYVVDDSTADSIKVWGRPVLSPDGTRFVLMSMSDFAAYDPDLIEIWRVVGRKPQLEFSLEPADYQPSDPVWRNSTTIDFIKNRIGGEPDYDFIKTPARLRRTGGKWIVTNR